jgi:putative phage-type endonuclease
VTLTAQQLATRRTGLGSSDVAGVVGVSTYSTPFTVWLSKVEGIDAPETDAMELGHRLEPVVLSLYNDRVAPALAWGQTLVHPQYPWALATPDGRTANGSCIVECKAPGYHARDAWGESGTDHLPDEYIVQCQWQMFVTGIRECHVAALIGGQDFRWYALRYDADLAAILLTECERFWRERVEAKSMPPVDGGERARAHLNARHARERAPMREWTPEALGLATDLAEARAGERTARARGDLAANRLRALIGDAEGIGDRGRRVTWKANAKGQRVLRLHGFGDEE